MPRYTVLLEQVAGTPVAVIRRQVSQAELSRVVPECCGLVWNAVRAQQAKGGRHVAIYRDGPSGSKWAWNCSARSPSRRMLSCRPRRPGQWRGRRILVLKGLGAAHNAVREWCANHGHRLAGPSWEILRALAAGVEQQSVSDSN